jgi:hypothetical protein
MELTLFEQFPEPVFYLRGGRIQYSNGAALALESTWAAGADVPEALALGREFGRTRRCAPTDTNEPSRRARCPHRAVPRKNAPS